MISTLKLIVMITFKLVFIKRKLSFLVEYCYLTLYLHRIYMYI